MSDSIERGGAAASSSQRANLEPVSEDAHPPENRRTPTNPQLIVEALQLVPTHEFAQQPASATTSKPPPRPEVLKRPVARSEPPARSAGGDRLSHLLIGTAVGLLALVLPARQLARQHERELLAEPSAAVEQAIAQPLETEVDPSAIQAQLDDIEQAVQRRYLLIWLGAGLPLGLALGFVSSHLLRRPA